MKMILKEVEPTSGEIYINGKSIVNIPHNKVPFLRRKWELFFSDKKKL